MTLNTATSSSHVPSSSHTRDAFITVSRVSIEAMRRMGNRYLSRTSEGWDILTYNETGVNVVPSCSDTKTQS